jgi:hypothetical protein
MIVSLLSKRGFASLGLKLQNGNKSGAINLLDLKMGRLCRQNKIFWATSQGLLSFLLRI